MDPAPVGVEHNRRLLRGAAAASRALLDGDGRVRLNDVGTSELCVRNSEESEGGEGGCAEHDCQRRGARPMMMSKRIVALGFIPRYPTGATHCLVTFGKIMR